METIHLFVKDTAFVNPSILVAPLLTTDGICALTNVVLANYLSPTFIKDPRASRVTLLSFGNSLSVVTDGNSAVSDFIANYSTQWVPYQTALFDLIDQLGFNYVNQPSQAAWDTYLTGNPQYSIYKAGSLAFSSTHTVTTVYINNAPVSITVPDFLSFQVTVSINSVETVYCFYFWLNSAIFNQQYPVSNITAITIPLTFTDLLNIPITGSTYNALSIAKEASNNIYGDLTVSIPYTSLEPITDGISGYTTYSAKFVDSNQNYIFMPFNVLYKGHEPGILQIRAALKAILLASGVGTSAQWQARIPELFVNAQYYIIPIWDNTEQLPDSTVYPDIVSIAHMLYATGKVMYDLTTLFISTNAFSTVAAWNAMILAVVPDVNNPSDRLSFRAELPEYQFYGTTDSNYNLMPALTKAYSVNLNNALPVAAGLTSSNAFAEVALNNRNFFTFTVGDVEYYLVTKETYLNLVTSSMPGGC